jgi:hypothetical protein
LSVGIRALRGEEGRSVCYGAAADAASAVLAGEGAPALHSHAQQVGVIVLSFQPISSISSE